MITQGWTIMSHMYGIIWDQSGIGMGNPAWLMYFSFYEYVRGHGGGRQSAYLDDATVILMLFTKAFLFLPSFFSMIVLFA